MSLLTPNPRVSKKDIDVYLNPMVDKWNELWSDGIKEFDALTRMCFKMLVVVL